jgi:nitric oxide reductase large subunit
VAAQHRRLSEEHIHDKQPLKYKSQSVAKLYFIAALALFTGQIIFGLTWACST